MNLRPLLCAALLLVTPALGRQSSAPADAAQQTGSGLSGLQVECTPASGATEWIGKHACIAGKVYRITVQKSGNTHLWLCPGRKCSFQAVVSGRDRATVGDLSYLRGKLVAVVGDVTESRGGRPIIAVKQRGQIRSAASAPPPEFDAAQARPTINGKANKRDRAWK